MRNWMDQLERYCDPSHSAQRQGTGSSSREPNTALVTQCWDALSVDDAMIPRPGADLRWYLRTFLWLPCVTPSNPALMDVRSYEACSNEPSKPSISDFHFGFFNEFMVTVTCVWNRRGCNFEGKPSTVTVAFQAACIGLSEGSIFICQYIDHDDRGI